jgi:hypothetical protein
MTTVEDVTRSRLRLLQQANPQLVYEDDYMDTEEGLRGLIRAMDGRENVVGLEFVEPEGLWADPDAVEEYAETLEEGIAVTVIVPPAERADAEALLRAEAGEVTVLGYDELGEGVGPGGR